MATVDCALFQSSPLLGFQHHCTLPSFEHHIAAMAFDPGVPQQLTIAFSNNTFQIFDVEARRFPEWAQTLSKDASSRLTGQQDSVLGVAFDPAAPTERSLLLWGSTWICKIHLEGSTGRPSQKRRRQSTGTGVGQQQRRGADEDESNSNFRVVSKYRQVVAVDFLSPGELVVVERPLADILHTLPPAYFKPKYGS